MTLIYDVEVFKENSMVVFKNIEGETVKVFSSSLNGLGEYLDKGVLTHEGYEGLEEYVTGKTLIGFNNYHFDDYILYAMSKNLPQRIIKEWNDSIIQGSSKINMKKIEVCKTLDVFQQIDVSRPSLKKIEGNMGRSIVESKVPFDIDRVLTPAENLETLKYCEYDVLQTLEIYRLREEYYSSKDAILEMIEDKSIKDRAYKWNTTSITGHILKPKRRAAARRHVSDEMLNQVDETVRGMWRELDSTIDFQFKKKKVVISEFGNDIEFGWGGLHGAPKGVVKRTDVKLADVGSMYPNILIIFNGLGDKTMKYKNILDYRLKLKHEGKKAEQAPYKLILNSTYGLLNNQYSVLNNPHLAYSICIYGQISLYVLSKELANHGAEIININTDGVAYRYDNDETPILKSWEQRYGLNLEVDHFKQWIQKDVNNYIAVAEDGYVVTKGGDVNKYSGNRFFANNDIRITHLALVENLINGAKIKDTLYNNLDNPLLYQYILQPGRTYTGVVTSEAPDTLLDTRINRVFATRGKGVELLKKRLDGGTVKFADAPTNMMIYNGELSEFTDFKDMVDLQWYMDLITKNLQRWHE